MKNRHTKPTQPKLEQQFGWSRHDHKRGDSRPLEQDAGFPRPTTTSSLLYRRNGSNAIGSIQGTQTAISRIIDPVPQGSKAAAPWRSALHLLKSNQPKIEQRSEPTSAPEASPGSRASESNAQGDAGRTQALETLINETRAKFKSVEDLTAKQKKETEQRTVDLMKSVRALDEMFKADPEACDAWMLKEAGKPNKRTVNPCYRFVKAAAPKGTHRQQVQHLAKVLWVLRKREIASSDVLNALAETPMKKMREVYDNEGPREPKTKRTGNTDAPQTSQETTNTADINEQAPEGRVQPLEQLIAHGSIQVLIEGRAVPVIGLVSVGLTYTLFLEEAQT